MRPEEFARSAIEEPLKRELNWLLVPADGKAEFIQLFCCGCCCCGEGAPPPQYRFAKRLLAVSEEFSIWELYCNRPRDCIMCNMGLLAEELWTIAGGKGLASCISDPPWHCC